MTDITTKKEVNREELKQILIQHTKEEIENGNGNEKAVPWLMSYNQALEMLENDFPYDDGSWNFIDLFIYCKKYGMGITTKEEDEKFHKDYGWNALESEEEYKQNGNVSPYYLKFKQQCCEHKNYK